MILQVRLLYYFFKLQITNWKKTHFSIFPGNDRAAFPRDQNAVAHFLHGAVLLSGESTVWRGEGGPRVCQSAGE